MGERLLVEHAVVCRMLENRLDLGGEDELTTLDGVVERLDAEEVPRAEQLARFGIVNGEREHAAHAIEHILRPSNVTDEQHLGVRIR